MTIQDTPKRSATIPNAVAKNVLPSGICTCPPSESARNLRSASSLFFTSRERAKPWKPGLPCMRPSETITVASPILSEACMTLSSEPGAHSPAGGFSGASLKRISISTFAPSAFL